MQGGNFPHPRPAVPTARAGFQSVALHGPHLCAIWAKDLAVLPGGRPRRHQAHPPRLHAVCQLLLDDLPGAQASIPALLVGDNWWQQVPCQIRAPPLLQGSPAIEPRNAKDGPTKEIAVSPLPPSSPWPHVMPAHPSTLAGQLHNWAPRKGHQSSCRSPPIGYTWSYLACRIGHCVPIWQPFIGSSTPHQTPHHACAPRPPRSRMPPACACRLSTSGPPRWV
jgi:hypothetical protein